MRKELFIPMLFDVHSDSKGLQHFARKGSNNQERSTMPVTAFVYQYFIYNSLYSIDWQSTFAQDKIVLHLNNQTEGYKQDRFEVFLREQAGKNPSVIKTTFSSIKKIPQNVHWIKIVPDPYITSEAGMDFFNRINQLYDLVQKPEDMVRSSLGNIFSRIQICRLFVYKVRNNIFHGTKSLGDIWDVDQRKRLEVYLQFLRALVDCFFACYEVAEANKDGNRPEHST